MRKERSGQDRNKCCQGGGGDQLNVLEEKRGCRKGSSDQIVKGKNGEKATFLKDAEGKKRRMDALFVLLNVLRNTRKKDTSGKAHFM